MVATLEKFIDSLVSYVVTTLNKENTPCDFKSMYKSSAVSNQLNEGDMLQISDSVS